MEQDQKHTQSKKVKTAKKRAKGGMVKPSDISQSKSDWQGLIGCEVAEKVSVAIVECCRRRDDTFSDSFTMTEILDLTKTPELMDGILALIFFGYLERDLSEDTHYALIATISFLKLMPRN